ncbi:MAG: hypothetical protein ACP5UH_00200 [Candidatus Micrarchaeia archaeon]
MNGKAKSLAYITVALAVMVVAALALFAIGRIAPQRRVSTTIVQSGCFNIPSNPTKQQVFSFIGMAYNGSSSAITAIRAYNSSGVLARYNLKVNMAKLSSQASNGICS